MDTTPGGRTRMMTEESETMQTWVALCVGQMCFV